MARIAVGTRVVLIGSRDGQGAGVIAGIRKEPWLRPYVVDLDDGRRVFASASHVAVEADPARTPLGPSLHED